MKKSILVYSLLFVTTLVFSQEFKISVAPTINNVHFYNYSIIGTYGQPRFGVNTDIDYLFITNKLVEFGFGLGLQHSNVQLITPHPDLSSFSAGTESVNLLSINLRSAINLNKDFYITLVPSFDLQIKPNDLQKLNNQTGIGLSLGIGNNVRLNESLSLNIEPRLWIHNIIPIKAERVPYRLTTVAINLGLVFGKKHD
jgi:hypothetical protein